MGGKQATHKEAQTCIGWRLPLGRDHHVPGAAYLYQLPDRRETEAPNHKAWLSESQNLIFTISGTATSFLQPMKQAHRTAYPLSSGGGKTLYHGHCHTSQSFVYEYLSWEDRQESGLWDKIGMGRRLGVAHL